MGQCNPLHLRVLAEFHHVFDRAMAPADLGRILLSSELRVVDEKIRAIDFTEGLAEALRAVYVPFVTGHKKRSEEWDSLDVIAMRMANQDVAAQAFSAGRHQIVT